MENTGFLLHKLQALKNWQKEQEDQLMKEQQLQLAELLQGNDHVLGNIQAIGTGYFQ